MTDAKKLVQQQFGKSAEAYATSAAHSRGASLGRIAELASPSGTDSALDVATAAGHTALTLAPLVRRVVGLDLTPEMMVPARRLATERGARNAEWMIGDVENLPLADASFEIVTCRIALHHWPDAARGVGEMARAAKPGGRVVLVDNVAPDDAHLADFLNHYEQVRDPSHHRCYSAAQLAEMFAAAGLRPVHRETLEKAIEYEDWVQRMRVPAAGRRTLSALLETTEARATIRPLKKDAVLYFHLQEVILVGEKSVPG
jgi:ubiquinone/menaquinone biosynthesis C-methylase UbiE